MKKRPVPSDSDEFTKSPSKETPGMTGKSIPKPIRIVSDEYSPVLERKRDEEPGSGIDPTRIRDSLDGSDSGDAFSPGDQANVPVIPRYYSDEEKEAYSDGFSEAPRDYESRRDSHDTPVVSPTPAATGPRAPVPTGGTKSRYAGTGERPPVAPKAHQGRRKGTSKAQSLEKTPRRSSKKAHTRENSPGDSTPRVPPAAEGFKSVSSSNSSLGSVVRRMEGLSPPSRPLPSEPAPVDEGRAWRMMIMKSVNTWETAGTYRVMPDARNQVHRDLFTDEEVSLILEDVYRFVRSTQMAAGTAFSKSARYSYL